MTKSGRIKWMDTKGGMKIRELQKEESPPMALLLLADPCEKLVREYLARGSCYVGEIDGDIVGEYLLVNNSDTIAELINVAVDPGFQGMGLGKQLVLHAIGEARRLGFKRIEIGTGNNGFMQLALYQKCGFKMVEIWKNFFIDHYEEAIYENGLRCTDMVRLAIDF